MILIQSEQFWLRYSSHLTEKFKLFFICEKQKKKKKKQLQNDFRVSWTILNNFILDLLWSVYKGSYMSVHALFNLLNELGKTIRCEALPSIKMRGFAEHLINFP